MGPMGFIMSLLKLFMRSAKQGAERVVYPASSLEVKDVTGKYLEKLKVKKSSDESYNEEIAKRLWDVSEQLTHMGY